MISGLGIILSILFTLSCLCWHDKWIGDNSLKTLYPKLFVCSANKEACVSDALCIPGGGNVRVWH